MSRAARIVAGVLLLCPAFVSAATLSFGAGLTYTEGDTVRMPILLSSEEPVNAASAGVLYDQNVLSLISISKAGSIVSLWAEEPSFTNTAGTAQFEGVMLNPGWNGASGVLVTLIFRAKASGSTVLRLVNGSVLANDGRGTELLSATYPTSLTIAPAPVQKTPDTAPAPKPKVAPETPTPLPQNEPPPLSRSGDVLPYLLGGSMLLLAVLVARDLWRRFGTSQRKRH